MDIEAFVLMSSRKGWATVEYEPKLWIPCLAVMPDGYDERRWARDFAWGWWSTSGLPHGDREMALLEAKLAHIYEGLWQDPLSPGLPAPA